MSEETEEKTEEDKPKETVEDTNDGVPGEVEEKSPLEQAKELNSENKELLKKITEERKKIEKALGDSLISGKGLAGQVQQPKEETDAEYRNRVEKEVAEGKYNDRG